MTLCNPEFYFSVRWGNLSSLHSVGSPREKDADEDGHVSRAPVPFIDYGWQPIRMEDGFIF